MGNSVQLMMSLFWAVPYFLELLIIAHQKEPIIRGRRLFQILLTGSRALNISLYYPTTF